MSKLTERIRGLVGRGNTPGDDSVAQETVPAELAPPLTATTSQRPDSVPTPASSNLTVEAAYSMLQAFPKETQDSQRLVALRSALEATAQQKNVPLQQLLAAVLQEKIRIASILQNQDRNFELQLTKITEAVDALWDKRDKLTEHHQRVSIEGKERLEGLDQLIQCLSLTDEAPPSSSTLTELTPPKVAVIAEEEEGPVIIRMPRMELRALGEDLSAEPESPSTDTEETDSSQTNRRKLYKMAA